MTRLTDRPDRSILTRIIREEAASAGVSETDVIQGVRAPAVMAARYAAIRRALKVTTCTQQGLARVWGIDVATIRQAMAEVGEKRAYPAPERAPKSSGPVYDLNTADRLAWAHGEARAAQIVAGRDPRTESDIARWRALGGTEGRAA